MTAIVTSQFRVLNAENFKEDVSDSGTSVYVGIGKPDVWSTNTADTSDTTPFTPQDTLDAIGEAYRNLIGLKLINASDISHVVPRYNWTFGNAYVAWDSDDASIYDKRFYVLTSEFKVYKCVRAGTGASTIQPTQTLTDPQSESDGYAWKYMYTIAVADAEKFLTISYMPVKTVSLDFASDAIAEANLSEGDYAQYLNQKSSRDSSTAMGIERIEVLDGGTDYTSAPEVIITGDGIGASATAIVSGGEVTGIVVNNKGTDYTVVNIEFSGGGGSDASARGVIAPAPGHGVDPVKELGAFFVEMNVQLQGSEDGDLTVGNDFRQVTLIKNPTDYGTTSISTATTLKAMSYLNFAGGVSLTDYQDAIQLGDTLVQGQDSGALAYAVEVDTDLGYVYYTQNSKTGYQQFEDGENVRVISGSTQGEWKLLDATSAIGTPELEPGSGQILFLENRDPINRTAQQIEDVKLIIEF